MPYLVDSNLVIDHLGNVLDGSQLIDQLVAEGIVISIVTYMEAFQGVIRSEQPEEASEKFHAFADKVLILPFSFAVAERCARLWETLRSQNKRVKSRALDLIIAATALEYGLTLVTKNTDDFKDTGSYSLPTRLMYPSPAFLQQVVAKIALQAPAKEECSLSLSIPKTG